MTELKPCPFCGKDVELKHCMTNGNDWWYVACRNCGIAVDPWMWNSRQTKKETIIKWNRREHGEETPQTIGGVLELPKCLKCGRYIEPDEYAHIVKDKWVCDTCFWKTVNDKGGEE